MDRQTTRIEHGFKKAAKAAGDRATVQANAWRQDMEDTHESHPWTPAWDWDGGWMMDDGKGVFESQLPP